MDIKRLAIMVALAASVLAGGSGIAQTEYAIPIDRSISEIVGAFAGPEISLPDELGDPVEYARVRDILPILVEARQFDTPQGLMAHLVEALGFAPDGRLVCPVDLDGQKYRVAGGKFIIAGGELPYGPVDVSDPDGDGQAGPFWTIEPSPLVLQIDPRTPIHLVLLDDFDFAEVTEISDFPMNGVESATGMHGHLVLYHSLLSLGADLSTLPSMVTSVDEAGPFSGMPLRWSQMTVDLASGGSATVTMIDVNFDEPLVHVADAVAFADLRFGDEPGVVFNSSWNLVPCNLSDAYDETSFDFQSFGHFLWHLVTNELDDPSVDELFNVYRQVYDGEDDAAGNQRARDLFEFRLILATNEVVASAVASLFDESNAWFSSAGNLSLDFPLPPASFGNITAVGACHLVRASPGETLQLDRASWSNLGTQNVLGAWFRGDLGYNRMAKPYAGSSYASPIAAIAHAAGTSDRLLDCSP